MKFLRKYFLDEKKVLNERGSFLDALWHKAINPENKKEETKRIINVKIISQIVIKNGLVFSSFKLTKIESLEK